MAYKVSYKVVSEQGEQLKNIAKDMDNYVSQLNQIVSKLGNDELLQSVRGDLNKFRQQLEEEKTVLNLAGQIIGEVVQNYTGVEKKSVSKVDKAKAHNRDFYKRPVAVASAGAASAGAAAGAAGGTATSYASSVNVSAVTNNQSVTNTTNIINAAAAPQAAEAVTAAASVTGTAAAGMSGKEAAMVGSIAAAVGSVAAAGGAVAGVELAEKKKAVQERSKDV